MSVVIAGSARATFEIKSANLPLVALRLKTTDLAALADDLTSQYGDMPDFFDNEPLVIDLTPLPVEATGIDFDALVTLLRGFHLEPIAFKGGNPALAALARATGLVAAPDAVATGSGAAASARENLAAQTRPSEEPVPEVSTPSSPLPALVIDKPLRSGQQIYARGRDLVMLAMVNAGAEVIADGHIHVYAPLRGKAIAGARGNPEARIFALSLEPELISIAGVYRTSETPLAADIQGKPAQVRLSDDGQEKLLFEALSS